MDRLLYADHIKINDAISIQIPKVGDVWDMEDDYYSAVSCIISTPYDMMVQLDEAGIDFTKITTFELFCRMFSNLQEIDTSLIFGELDLSKFELAFNKRIDEPVLYNEADGVVIDRVIHEQISSGIKRILQIKRAPKKPGNEEGKKYMIRIAKMNQRRQKRLVENKDTSQLEDVIISLVNNREFPYTYESVRNITIYQLYQSLNQAAHIISYDNTMRGLYAGTIKLEDIKPEERTWIKS